jgi:hypothetical protein
LVDDASTLSEGAVPEGPANLPTAFNVPIELGSDVELDEVYAQERRAWAEAQRNDPALRTLFSHAHGIHQKSKSIQKREPSIDSDGRLFVAFGHDHARRLVVPSERAPALHRLTSSSRARGKHRHESRTTMSRRRRTSMRRSAQTARLMHQPS